MKFEKVEPIEPDNGDYQGLRDGGDEKILVKGYESSVIRWISSGDLMYSMMTIVNNTTLKLKFAKQVNLQCFHYQKNW